MATLQDDAVRFVQIEVSTICNYQCFYCAGRDMPQRHMPMEVFRRILHKLPQRPIRVSLQGEGEPMAHPGFWQMADEITAQGKVPYTITNGSLIRDPARVVRTFPEIGISIDTLDPEEAQRIGRLKLARMLRKFDALLQHMPPERVIVHTVRYGQPLDDLLLFLKERGIRHHVVQPLQTKADYSARYPQMVAAQEHRYHFNCSYIRSGFMRFYTLDGVEMPCCFIKDASKFVSTSHIAAELAAQRVPAACTGCREIELH